MFEKHDGSENKGNSGFAKTVNSVGRGNKHPIIHVIPIVNII
jgi:hypothetical protein